MPTFPAPRQLPPRRLHWLAGALLAVVLAGAVVLAATGNHPPFQPIDDWWYATIHASRTAALTAVNLALNFVGNWGMVLYCTALFAVLLRRHRFPALYVAAVNLGTLGLTHLIKFLLARPRPGDRLVSVDSGAFPSGHVSATAAAVVCTALLADRLWIWVSGSLLVVAMMLSRAYLGAHWLSDTVAGAALGAGVALLLWGLLQDKCLQRHESSPQLADRP
ncbi:phosphatase PAP2 family protein [Arthrobacter sp. 35W]|uniref:phosphatase PAP2 family protein n=1 Tax=Arthrobacter sp. 35W TaxID=1132441 RepID=UPI00041BC00B|nr:phosphatase PAP2 family protein [Arthrobacter sp. 35W]